MKKSLTPTSTPTALAFAALLTVSASAALYAQNGGLIATVDTAAIADGINTDDAANVNTDTDAADASDAGKSIAEKANASPQIDSDAPQPKDEKDAAAAAPDTAKPKIAVYVTGGKDVGENKAFGTYILDAFIKSDRYIAIERSEAFLEEIDNEQKRQRSGAIDDAEISRLGKQSGVRFVCVADITQALKTYQVSARILDVETAKVITVGVSESPLSPLDELRAVSADVVYAMFMVLWPDAYPPPPPPGKKIKFGCRAAYVNSYVNDMTLQMHDFDGHRINDYDYANKVGAGHGFEIGVTAALFITNDFYIEAGGNAAYRRPVNTDVVGISEFAITFPILADWRIPESLFFVYGGALIEVPVKAMIKWEGQDPVNFGDRAPVDF